MPNVNSNPLPNYGGININMIKIDDELCMTNAIVSLVHEELEKVGASLSMREKKEFAILTLEKVVSLLLPEQSLLLKLILLKV